MLLLSGLSTAYARQLHYLVLRNRMSNRRLSIGIEAAGQRLTKRDPVPCVPALSQSRGNFSILSHSVSLSNRLSGTVQRLRQHSSTASRSGNLHPKPEGRPSQERFRWGVVLHLR